MFYYYQNKIAIGGNGEKCKKGDFVIEIENIKINRNIDNLRLLSPQVRIKPFQKRMEIH